jgi:hypothetical protein
VRDLSIPLHENYRSHPAFSFATAAWTLPESTLAKFNDTYVFAREMGSSLDSMSRAELHQGCQVALDEVMQSLLAQCSNDPERLFVGELHAQCSSILADELSWFSVARRPSIASLTVKNVLSNAISLRTVRHYFGRLPASAVEEMQRISAEELRTFRSRAAAGRLTRDDLSTNTGNAVREIRKVLNREFRDIGVLDAVSAYAGAKMQVAGLALELSVPQASWWNNAMEGLSRPARTLYAHLDETLACPKSIVYLTDVREENGPTGCYPGAYDALKLNPLQELIGRRLGNVGNDSASPLKAYYGKQYHQSMSSTNFRQHYMRLPERLRFNSHLGWDVLPDSELEHRLAEGEIRMTGPAGTFIAFDGARLLHRGGLMEAGERVALQVIFSDTTLARRAISRVKRMLT